MMAMKGERVQSLDHTDAATWTLSQLSRNALHPDSAELVKAMLTALPGAPPIRPYASLAEAARTVAAPDDPRSMQQAAAWLAAPALIPVPAIAAALDDLTSADLAAKALAVALLAELLFPGDATAKLGELRTLPAGRALLMFLAAEDVVLPFSDQIDDWDGRLVQARCEAEGATACERLGALSGCELPEVSLMQARVAAVLDRAAVSTLPHLERIEQAIAPFSGLRRPYRFLVTRLAAEAAVIYGGALSDELDVSLFEDVTIAQSQPPSPRGLDQIEAMPTFFLEEFSEDKD